MTRYVAGAVLLGLVTPAFAQQPPTPTPVATTAEIMRGVVVPTSNAVFEAAGQAPQTDAAWAALRMQALILAESGNLLMVGKRARDGREWMQRSAALRDAAEAIVKAVDARNAVRLAEMSDQTYDTCEQCHVSYMQR
jgi:hypothetical protein